MPVDAPDRDAATVREGGVRNGALTVAVPRSAHHLALLADNDARPDLILLRDAALVPAVERLRGVPFVFLDREQRPGRSPASFRAARAANRAYYRDVARRLSDLRIGRLILFLEGEPLERFLLELHGTATVELWEDGLSHYLDLTGSWWYRLRALGQHAAGFHPHGIYARRIDRTRVVLRDRFECGNLRLAPPAAPSQWRREVLVVGSPLVGDGIVSPRRFAAGLRAFMAASPLPVRYLPHPREEPSGVLRALVGSDGLLLADGGEGLFAHLGRYGYAAYASAISTGLLDAGRHDRSLFAPALFGLGRAHRALRGWRANPLPVARDARDLRRLLLAITASAGPGPSPPARQT